MRSVVIGASGYTGAELLRILAFHPEIEVVSSAAASHAGQRIAELYPSLLPRYEGEIFSNAESIIDDISTGAKNVDIAFLALPHGTSQSVVPGSLIKLGLS